MNGMIVRTAVLEGPYFNAGCQVLDLLRDVLADNFSQGEWRMKLRPELTQNRVTLEISVPESKVIHALDKIDGFSRLLHGDAPERLVNSRERLRQIRARIEERLDSGAKRIEIYNQNNDTGYNRQELVDTLVAGLSF